MATFLSVAPTEDWSSASSVLDQKVKLFKEFSRLSGSETGDTHDRRQLDRQHGEEAIKAGWAVSRWS